jgi:hypothetical protein
MSDEVLVTFSKYLEQSGHRFDCNEDGPTGALALCAAAVLFVLLATVTAAHDSFLGRACNLKLEKWSVACGSGHWRLPSRPEEGQI